MNAVDTRSLEKLLYINLADIGTGLPQSTRLTVI